MAHDILPYCETQRRPLTDIEVEAISTNAQLGVQATIFLEPGVSFAAAVRERIHKQLEQQGRLDVRALLGYSIGLRRGRFAPAEESQMAWNEISARSVDDFRKGHAYGSRAADTTPNLSTTRLLDSTIEFFGDGLLPIKTNAALLGHIAAVNAVDLARLSTSTAAAA